MGLYKNVASQKIAVYAYDKTADGPKTGDAANITAQISKDFGAAAATNDANPTELDSADHPGVYVFDLTQAETDADNVLLTAVSGTADIVIDPVQVFTVPPNFRALGIESDGHVHADVKEIEGSDATNQIRDAVVDDATRIDASALNTASGAIGSDGTGLTEAGGTGDHLTAINLPNQTMDIVGNITGDLSGSVGSVTGLTASDVGAIKLKTDNLPSDPADQSLIIAATDAIVAAIAALNNLSEANVLTQVNAALDTALADSVPADGSLPTLRQAIYMNTQFLFERSASGTTVTVKKVDGSTTLMTLTLDDATAPTSITRAS